MRLAEDIGEIGVPQATQQIEDEANRMLPEEVIPAGE